MKRLTLFLACFVLASLAAFAAGRQQQPGQQTAGTDPYANLPLEISVSAHDRGSIKASEGTLEDNRWTRWINENSGVKVSWVPVLRSESRQRINTLFAAGAAPDLVVDYDKVFMDDLYAQGVIQPVGPFIEKYSTSYKQYLKDHPDLLPYLSINGEQYGVSSARNVSDLIVNTIWVRKDWLDKFGMGMPKTTEELLAFFRRVRDEDPDGNGVKDTYGMVFRQAYMVNILQTIFGKPYDNFLVENGRYVDWTSTQGYRDYLAFLTTLYREGYIDPEFITDAQYQRANQLFSTGKAAMYLGPFTMEALIRDLGANVPGANAVTMDTWTASQGKWPLPLETPFNYMVCLNKDAKNPKAAVMFMDWLISEGWFTMEFGLEGRHYNLVNGIPVPVYDQAIRDEIGYNTGANYNFLSQYSPTTEWFIAQAQNTDFSRAFARLKGEYYAFRSKDKPRRFVPYGPVSENISRYNAEISAQVTAFEMSIVTGRTALEAGIQQINNFKRAAGWDSVNTEKDAWYQQNKQYF
jgi:putative aldouronate transport system substrate-binding protein